MFYLLCPWTHYKTNCTLKANVWALPAERGCSRQTVHSTAVLLSCGDNDSPQRTTVKTDTPRSRRLRQRWSTSLWAVGQEGPVGSRKQCRPLLLLPVAHRRLHGKTLQLKTPHILVAGHREIWLEPPPMASPDSVQMLVTKPHLPVRPVGNNADQARCAHWRNHGKSVVGIANRLLMESRPVLWCGGVGVGRIGSWKFLWAANQFPNQDMETCYYESSALA